MHYIKLYEDFKTSVITYHAGREPLEKSKLKPGIFTTTDYDGVMWYAERASDNNNEAYISTMELRPNNPLMCRNHTEFEEKWIPILDQLDFDYKYEKPSGEYGGWSFFSTDIIKHGGYLEDNIYDLIYVDGFKDKCLELGYDCIYGHDVLSNYEIEVYIVLDPSIVINIENEKKKVLE